MKRKKRRNIIIWSVVALIVVIAGYFSFIRPQQQANGLLLSGLWLVQNKTMKFGIQ